MILYIVLIVIFVAIYVFLLKRSSTKVPSGMKSLPIEKGWPIIGILNGVKGPLCNYLTELGKKHGGIYLIRFGMRDVLVLNNIECMKAALVDNGEAFSGRWRLKEYLLKTEGYGILHNDGKLWSQQRSYILRTLKDFGIGRSRSVEIVQDECVFLLKEVENLHSKPTDFFHLVSLYTANVISKFIMNKRFSHDDPEMRTIQGTMKILTGLKDNLTNFVLMMPFLERNVWLVNFLVWVSSRKSLVCRSYKIFEKEIEERLKTLDLHSEGEDLMERFLIKQHQLREKDGSVGFFTDQQLIISSFQLFIAGYDTTSWTLTWSFMFMAMYPDIQRKVYEEISDKIGTERLPTMSDKPSLVYTQAVMDEVMRLGTVAPLAIPHRTLSDICVNGYFIPKDTLVLPNILASHVDPTIWEKPLEFYPEHFISTDEKGNFKYEHREELVPFGTGKRQCLGEPLARTMYFIFFTAILQRFHVSLPNGMAGMTHFDVFRAEDGLIRKPNFKDFIFRKRSSRNL